MDLDQLLSQFEQLASAHDGLVVKGKKMPYVALGGNMFAFVDSDGVFCVRLSEPEKADFNSRHGGSDVLQYGAVMRGYVAVPERILSDRSALADLFAKSLEFIRTLPPKPTKR